MLYRCLGADMLVLRDRRCGTPRAGHLDRDDLLRKTPLRSCTSGQCVAAGRKHVLGLARDVVAGRQVLRRLRHPETAGCVSECGPQRVLQRCRTQGKPLASTADDERRLTHVLGSTREDDLGFPRLDQTRAIDRRLEPRSAQTVESHGRALDAEPDLEPDVAGQVHRVTARLHDITERHVVHDLRVDPGAGQGASGGRYPELRRRDPAKAPTKTSKRRPGAVEDYHAACQGDDPLDFTSAVTSRG